MTTLHAWTVRGFASGLVAFASANFATGTVTTIVDLLDGSDAGGPSPNGIIVADVYADVTDGDSWTVAGIFGDTFLGAALRYAHDSNGRPQLVNPGTADRYVTFFSKPRGRDSDARFNDGGVGIAGGYIDINGHSESSAARINVACFASPPPTAGSLSSIS